MERTCVLTDSNVCLPRDLSRQLGIRIVPITILLGGEARPDDSIDPQLVFDALAREDTVKSSPPSVFDYLNAIDDEAATGVLILTPAAEFTSMYLHACHAAELSTRPVRVVDTRTAAAAQRLVALEVARAAQGGSDLATLEELARDVAARVELVAVLDRVTTIERSGRVPSPVLESAQGRGGFGAFRFRTGSVVPLPAGADEPLEVLRRVWAGNGGPAASAAAVFHAGAPQRAEQLRALLTGDEPVIPFSPAMAIHTGPGVVGVAWVRSPEQ